MDDGRRLFSGFSSGRRCEYDDKYHDFLHPFSTTAVEEDGNLCGRWFHDNSPQPALESPQPALESPQPALESPLPALESQLLPVPAPPLVASHLKKKKAKSSVDVEKYDPDQSADVLLDVVQLDHGAVEFGRDDRGRGPRPRGGRLGGRPRGLSASGSRTQGEAQSPRKITLRPRKRKRTQMEEQSPVPVAQLWHPDTETSERHPKRRKVTRSFFVGLVEAVAKKIPDVNRLEFALDMVKVSNSPRSLRMVDMLEHLLHRATDKTGGLFAEPPNGRQQLIVRNKLRSLLRDLLDRNAKPEEAEFAEAIDQGMAAEDLFSKFLLSDSGPSKIANLLQPELNRLGNLRQLWQEQVDIASEARPREDIRGFGLIDQRCWAVPPNPFRLVEQDQVVVQAKAQFDTTIKASLKRAYAQFWRDLGLPGGEIDE